MVNQILKKISFCLFFLLLCFIHTLYAQNGIVKSYYADGTVQTEVSYVNDVLDGAMITYFSNGKIHKEKNYSRGILEGYVREYFENGLMKEEYFVKTGVKDRAYKKYSENGQLEELINYSDGKLTSRQIFDSDFEDRISNDPSIVQKEQETVIPTEKQVQKIQESVLPVKEIAEKKEEIILGRNKSEILCDTQVCPVPIGGIKGIQDNLIYPDHALQYGLEGTVTIIATINAKGEVIKTQVLKKLGLGCDEAAQEVLRKTKFIPGKNNGEPIETNATINIEFKIFDKKSIR